MHILRRGIAAGLLPGLLFASTARAADKPVLLYSQYFNAPGENRYPADGVFSKVIEALRKEFDIRVNAEPLNAQSLAGVRVLLLANPNDLAHGTNPPPHHLAGADAMALYNWIVGGGSVILMGNQEGHNLETRDVNRFLGLIGLQWVDRYTDAKKLVLSDDVPLIGGLNWAYYTGNQIAITPNHPARPRALVINDLNQKPLKGSRDEAGCLLALAEPGKGRVVLVTDSGWIANWALDNQGIGGVAIEGQDNLEIMLRLTRWVARMTGE
jgi:hypothetical protein